MRAGDALGEAMTVRDQVAWNAIHLYAQSATADSRFFFAPHHLEVLLKTELVGNTDLAGLPVRTRAKVAKTLVCEALGYEAPPAFVKVRGGPRLPHPAIDVYAQQASNLQIWNDEVDAERRYVILILDDFEIRDVKVIAGADLAQFDKTGKLTTKFQAARIGASAGSKLVSAIDTSNFISRLKPGDHSSVGSPVAQPKPGEVLRIADVYERLKPMVGRTYDDPGVVQERNRGTVIHREACERLGASRFADNGQFPDILSQLVEVKLQLARTVDLGLELPDSDTPLASANGLLDVRDVRYAIFYATRTGAIFTVDSLVLSTGADFFKEYRQFGGLTSNKKLQLKLPTAWFGLRRE
ncbi:restriction endonuclease [Plantibacter sp. CFBP 13570]|uniref:restriction endonuclease n=1 Tax=Plantibacter sp. CFBP 13570 TaxID=2775272 RepID=UPI001930925D|nr:restriction endonuclease [Plantibacter sp. CFBP 13570]MBD8534419.1 hypothetical protein [Plantibacter sp. CFBP 13570]